MQPETQPVQDECAECTIPVGQNLVDNGDGSSTLHCVKCPFCQQIASAHMTKTQISCPECKAVATYN